MTGAVALAFIFDPLASKAERVVILHTNDTHSQIDPDRQKGTGGVLRRKAAIDSVRHAERNILLVDAGDAVQGTLYFTLFEGEVEQKMLNLLGYDVQILGNHEFDNGMDILARNYSEAIPTVISSNYDVSSTPLSGLFQPYVVKQVGNRRIGFLAINIDPTGLISPVKSAGVVYNDGLEAARRMSTWLKNVAGVDAVVAVTHIGYNKGEKGYCDPDIAKGCPDIDVIIGGHSHTPLTPEDPRTRIVRNPGDTVLVVQNAKGAHHIGMVMLDFDKNGLINASWDRIPVDSRWDNRTDSSTEHILAQYRNKVDSIYAIPVVKAGADFDQQAMMNFASDVVLEIGNNLVKGRKVDFAIMNKGGIRHYFDAGDLSRGDIIDVFPFDNRIVVLDVAGKELPALFDLMARQGGQAVSANVDAVISADGKGCSSVTVDGKAIDPTRTYRIATIDYLAEGGDDMKALSTGRIIATSKHVLYDDMIFALSSKSSNFVPDSSSRMK